MIVLEFIKKQSLEGDVVFSLKPTLFAISRQLRWDRLPHGY